jgi:hypothetical protein
MNETQLKEKLQQVDRCLTLPAVNTADFTAALHRRLTRRKHTFRLTVPAAAAAVIMAFLLTGQFYRLKSKDRQITQLQNLVRDLSAQTEATLALAQQMLNTQNQSKSTRQYTNSSSPARQIQTTVNEAAFLLIYQAQQLEEQPGRKDDAVDCYNQVIQYFGDTPSANTARQRLKQIKDNNQPNHI